MEILLKIVVVMLQWSDLWSSSKVIWIICSALLNRRSVLVSYPSSVIPTLHGLSLMLIAFALHDVRNGLTSSSILVGNVMGSMQLGSIIGFLKEKGFDDETINVMLKRCKRLEGVGRERACENWIYLNKIGIHERKIPSVVSKCPKILALGLNEKLVPMVQCLATLGTKPSDVSMAITKFPQILSHSVEEKLCPLLAFFQALGIHEKQLGKILLLNPRLISYSIESKLKQIVEFLSSLGLDKEGMIGKILVKHPFIMGYSVEKRLRPTSEFLKSVGLKEHDLQRVALNFPEVLCRDEKKILRTNLIFLRNTGFNDRQIATLVTSYPPILVKSIKNSLEPRILFLREVMGRDFNEIVDYPECFQHGLKKRLELRHRMLEQRNIVSSLSEMLECNHRKFVLKFGIC